MVHKSTIYVTGNKNIPQKVINNRKSHLKSLLDFQNKPIFADNLKMSKTTQMGRLKRLKKIRIHREGTHTLAGGLFILLIVNAILYFGLECKLPFYVIAIASIVSYGMLINFFRCPIRLFGQDTEKVVVAPADGKVVVVEEVEENEYFHDRRIMVSIFMSIVNVHANWYPVDGTIKKVSHQNGKFMKAWLPKASTDNERSTIIIETPEGVEVLTRQIAGAMARRIVTYAEAGDECYIDEHMGFIKFGSRVDVYLPLDTEILVTLGQATTGNQTVIAKLK
jgi:phosphatidylserine decarboxylase